MHWSETPLACVRARSQRFWQIAAQGLRTALIFENRRGTPCGKGTPELPSPILGRLDPRDVYGVS